MEQLNAAHISEASKESSGADFGPVITKAVKGLYTEVAQHPDKPYHFPLGKTALVYVGYPESEINKIPASALESFAGVGYPHASNAIKPGDTVLDIGSGSGTDVLFSSLRTGEKGEAIGLDITDAMIEKARKNIVKMGAKNVKIMKGDAAKIPLEDSSVDVVTSNGVLNLVPDKKKAFQEIYRVLKPGGTIQIADIIVQKDVQKACGLIPQLWADCIGGASVEQDYLQLIRASGFRDVKVINRLDYFAESSSDNTKRLTKTFDAESIVVRATKP
jgi:SAM-dependent methyltransferase